jgi:hypothetical protein
MRPSVGFTAILCFLSVLAQAQARPIPALLARPGERLYGCGSVMPASPLAPDARGVTDLSIHISPAGLVGAHRLAASAPDDLHVHSLAQ